MSKEKKKVTTGRITTSITITIAKNIICSNIYRLNQIVWNVDMHNIEETLILLIFSFNMKHGIAWTLKKIGLPETYFIMGFCTNNCFITSCWGESGSAGTCLRKPSCNRSTNTRNFQRSKEAWQPGHHGPRTHNSGYNCQCLTSNIITGAVISFEICFCY